MNYGFEYGLISKEDHERVIVNEKLISGSLELFANTKLHARDINPFLESKGLNGIDSTETISKLCKRPELNLKELISINHISEETVVKNLLKNPAALEQVEIELKYEGYIKRQYETVGRLEKYEDTIIPLTLNYLILKSLSAEGREKLNKVKPRSIGQASRISGVTPSDISILLVYLKN